MTGCRALCPHCDVDVWWVSDHEWGRHVAACRLIEHGLFVADLETAIPEVESKPDAWRWVPRP